MYRPKCSLYEASLADNGAHSLSPNTFSLCCQVFFNNDNPSCSEFVPLLKVCFFAILLSLVSIFLRIQAANLKINTFFDFLEIIYLALLPIFKGLLSILFQNFEVLLFHILIHQLLHSVNLLLFYFLGLFRGCHLKVIDLKLFTFSVAWGISLQNRFQFGSCLLILLMEIQWDYWLS